VLSPYHYTLERCGAVVVSNSAVSGPPTALKNLQPHFDRHVRQQARLEESADDNHPVYRLQPAARNMTTRRRKTSIR
jgi:hypothetical protein